MQCITLFYIGQVGQANEQAETIISCYKTVCSQLLVVSQLTNYYSLCILCYNTVLLKIYYLTHNGTGNGK